MAALRLTNLAKVDRSAEPEPATLRDVTFETGEREFVTILAPAGSGKTTLLRLIAGLEEPSAGEIRLGDRVLNEVPPHERDLAMVFSDGALYPEMTVRENLVFCLLMRKFGRAEMERRIADVAATFALSDLLDRQPASLSVADRMRTALARAVIRQPKLLLLDARLSTLCSASWPDGEQQIAKLPERIQAPVIHATCDSAEASAFADRIVVLHRGAVQQIGTAEDLYSAPANLFVAGFVGSPPMNLLDGRLSEGRDGIAFRESGDGTIDVRVPTASNPTAEDVVLGIQPEHIEIAGLATGQKSAPGTFRALVELVQPEGGGTLLRLQTGGHRLVCRTSRRIDRAEAGHRMQFALDVARVHLFGKATGERLR